MPKLQSLKDQALNVSCADDRCRYECYDHIKKNIDAAKNNTKAAECKVESDSGDVVAVDSDDDLTFQIRNSQRRKFCSHEDIICCPHGQA